MSANDAPAEVVAPVALAVALLADLLAAAGLPDTPLGPPVTATRDTPIDGAGPYVSTWKRSGQIGPADAGVEVAVASETAWWNPHTIARSSVRVSVIDRRAGTRMLQISAEPPFQDWRVLQDGDVLVPREWIDDWLRTHAPSPT